MGDGRIDRAIKHGKARTTEIKTRVPELTERMPEFRERVPELRERVPELTARGAGELRNRGSELRTKGSELRTRSGELARQYAKMDVSWARCGYAKAAREALLSFGLGPLIDYYVRRRTVGREIFDTLSHPVVFVANHSSHLDTPTLLRAMPRKWRARTAVTAAADYFYKSRWSAIGVALLFNTVPLGRKGGGLGNGATDHVDRLIDQGWNLVMFPEGTRSRDGSIGKVHSGAAVIAAHHDIDIVPVYLSGTHEAMPPGQNWPRRIRGQFFSRRHQVEVRFGEPIRPLGVEERREVMDRVRAFWARKGLPAGHQTEPTSRPDEVAAEPRSAPEAERLEPDFQSPVEAPPAPAHDPSERETPAHRFAVTDPPPATPFAPSHAQDRSASSA